MKQSDQIPYIVSSIRKSVYQFIEDELAKNSIEGLMYTHCAILFALYNNSGSMKLSDIAELINRTKPTVSVMVDKLEEIGYAKRVRSNKDNRIIMVEITESGNSVKNIFDKININLRKKIFADMTPKEQDTLVKLLFKMQKNF